MWFSLRIRLFLTPEGSLVPQLYEVHLGTHVSENFQFCFQGRSLNRYQPEQNVTSNGNFP